MGHGGFTGNIKAGKLAKEGAVTSLVAALPIYGITLTQAKADPSSKYLDERFNTKEQSKVFIEEHIKIKTPFLLRGSNRKIMLYTEA